MIGKCETLPQTLGALHQLVGFCQRGVDLRRQRVTGAHLPSQPGFRKLVQRDSREPPNVALSTRSALSTIVRTVRTGALARSRVLRRVLAQNGKASGP